MAKGSLHIILLAGFALFASCSKSTTQQTADPEPETPDTLTLSYGDSVLYIAEGANDRIVTPKGNPKGRYYGFPEGIELDELTGEINVNKSETGLRYRISFVPEGKTDTLYTIMLLSGINYIDRIYHLDKDDTLASAVYNGRTENNIPGQTGQSIFDEGDGCKNEGIVFNKKSGRIDLAAAVRNGVFGDEPKDGAQKEVELLYRIEDGSKKALNKLKVKFYYFETADKITADLVDLVSSREGMFLGLNPQPPFLSYVPRSTPGTTVINNGILGTAKPRPPCIFLVGRLSRQ